MSGEFDDPDAYAQPPDPAIADPYLRCERMAVEIDALRARVAELETALEKQREVHQKWMRERPVAPHPVDQLNNLSKALHEDAEAECEALRARNAELVAALELLVADVEQYEAWQRPCYALDNARAALAAEPASGEDVEQ